MSRNLGRSNKRRRALARAASVLTGLVVGAGALAGCQTPDPVPGISATPSLAVVPSSPSSSSPPPSSPDPSSSSPSVAQPTIETAVRPAPAATQQAPAPAPKLSPSAAPAPKKPTTANNSSCPAGSYRNSNGVCVQSPVQAPAPPAGATAKCKDGSYSFSQHRSGTCSGHGGVAQWL